MTTVNGLSKSPLGDADPELSPAGDDAGTVAALCRGLRDAGSGMGLVPGGSAEAGALRSGGWDGVCQVARPG